MGQSTPGAHLLNSFVKAAQIISLGSNQNYYQFADFKEWRKGGLSALVNKLAKKPSSPRKYSEQNGGSFVPRNGFGGPRGNGFHSG